MLLCSIAAGIVREKPPEGWHAQPVVIRAVAISAVLRRDMRRHAIEPSNRYLQW